MMGTIYLDYFYAEVLITSGSCNPLKHLKSVYIDKKYSLLESDLKIDQDELLEARRLHFPTFLNFR